MRINISGAGLRLPAPPRLVVLDVDGTLLTTDHRVTPATTGALADVRARGIGVLLATSRGPVALPAVLQQVALLAPEIFIASQGAVTGRYRPCGELEILDQRPAPVQPARQLVDRALDVGLSVSWFSGDRWLVSHVDAMVEAEVRAVGAVPEVRDLFAEARGPDKIMLMVPPGQLESLRRITATIPEGLVAQTSGPNFLEITGTDVSKGTDVRAYCHDHRIALDTVVAMGDGLNDLPLFEAAGTTVAPENARPEVLDAATFVTRSNDEDGVAHALRCLLG